MQRQRSPGLVAESLWLRRGGREVLHGASVTVPHGCVTALVAPSGAGKSTILRCMTRLIDPDAGTITLEGTDVRELPPRELRRRVKCGCRSATTSAPPWRHWCAKRSQPD